MFAAIPNPQAPPKVIDTRLPHFYSVDSLSTKLPHRLFRSTFQKIVLQACVLRSRRSVFLFHHKVLLETLLRWKKMKLKIAPQFEVLVSAPHLPSVTPRPTSCSLSPGPLLKPKLHRSKAHAALETSTRIRYTTTPQSKAQVPVTNQCTHGPQQGSNSPTRTLPSAAVALDSSARPPATTQKPSAAKVFKIAGTLSHFSPWIVLRGRWGRCGSLQCAVHECCVKLTSAGKATVSCMCLLRLREFSRCAGDCHCLTCRNLVIVETGSGFASNKGTL